MQLSERDLEFDFSGAQNAIRFDDGIAHARSSVQPVDFIVEHADHFMFIEVKDPDEPGAINVEAFREKLKSGKLVRSLAGKFRDSFFFRTIQGVEKKPTKYVVLLAMAALDDALLVNKQDELKRSLPISHEQWPEDCVTSCVVMNVHQWKRIFGEDSLKRRSASLSILAVAPQLGA